MPAHELDELVDLDHPAIVLVHLLHDQLDLLAVVIEAQGFHEICELELVDGLGGGRGTLEWLVSNI